MMRLLRRSLVVDGCMSLVLAGTAFGQGGKPSTRTLVADVLIDGGSAHLSALSWVAIAPSGERLIVVSGPAGDAGEQTVRLYSGTASVVLEPPASGDVARVTSAGWVADSPWVRREATVTVYTPVGAPARSTSLLFTVVGLPTGRRVVHGTTVLDIALLRAVYPGGDLLLGESPPFVFPHLPHPSPFELGLVRISDLGDFRRVIGATALGVDGCQAHAYPFGDTPAPFCKLPNGIVSPGGAVFGNLEPAKGRSSDSAAFALAVITAAGDTLYAKQYLTPGSAVTSHEADSAFKSVHRALSANGPAPAGFADSVVKMLRLIRVPFHAPVVSFLLDDDGTVWLQLFSRAPERQWMIIDRRGAVVGVAVLPESIQLQAVRGTTAWGIDQRSNGAANVIRVQWNR